MSGASVIEAVLLRANESHTKAGTTRTVTLLLPNDGEHPFRGLACGPDNGQRMAISIALIGDDETQSGPIKDRRKFDELRRSQRAGMLCDDARFQTFLIETYDAPIDLVNGNEVGRPETESATAVRQICNVNSRAQFDTNEQAAARWDTLYSEYVTWSRT